MSNTLTPSPRERCFFTDKGTAARRTRFEIGDVKEPSIFYPQFKTLHWDNESNLSVRLVDADYARGTVTETDKGVEWRTADRIVRFYETEPDQQNDEGGFELEVELLAPPASNVLEFTIRAKDFQFVYQPPLEAWEIERGCIRPEDFVGSYVAFHASKAHNFVGGKNYGNGKAFHIKRPWARDATGKRVWCPLNIDAGSERLTITIPQAFLDAAVYPVLVDPTYGYTTNGGTEDGTNDSALAYLLGAFGGTNNSTSTGFVWYGRYIDVASGVTLQCGLYSNNSGVPNVRQMFITSGATESLNTTPATHTINVTNAFAIQNGVNYFLGIASDLGNGWRNYYDTGGTDDSFTSVDLSLPATWTEAGSSGAARRYSYYLNIVDPEGGGGAENPAIRRLGLTEIGRQGATFNPASGRRGDYVMKHGIYRRAA